MIGFVISCLDFMGFLAPPAVFRRYNQARRAHRKIADELVDRVVSRANRRLGYTSAVNIDTIVGTREVMNRCPAGAA